MSLLESISEVLNNPWVSSILGGFVVYFVTNLIFSKKENKEYEQKVQTANNELLYNMRPLIAQEAIPKSDIIESIMRSISRKYEIKTSDLLDFSLMRDDLIREVMESTFLDTPQKIKFCEKIKQTFLKNKSPLTEGAQQPERIFYPNKSFSQEYTSVMLALMTSLTALIFGYSTFEGNAYFFSIFKSMIINSPAIPLLIPLLVLSVTYVAAGLFVRKRQLERKIDLNQQIKKHLYRYRPRDHSEY